MTLRARLLSLILSTVTVVAFAMVALDLNSLAGTSIDVALGSSEMAASQVKAFIQRRLNETAARMRPPSVEEARRLWRETIAGDPDIAALLEQSMAQSRSIVEIDVAGENGTILSSSNPLQRGVVMRSEQNLRALRDRGPYGRIAAILTAHDDYETRIPLGIEGQQPPLCTIQVLVSPVLLRDATLPLLKGLLGVSGGALALAFALAWWAANAALRPLSHIGHLIDDIAAGRAPDSSRAGRDAQELAIIESKLSLLGERYRDARENASQLRLNLDGVLQKLDAETRRQFENQLGLARRLTAIASLTGRVAHEIKNPLNSIALRLEMLRARMAEESPDAEPEFAILSQEVTRLDRVVRTFLDFNRPVELTFEDVDIGEEAADILHLMEPEAALLGIAVSCLRPSDVILVKADAGLLRQALLNIVVNAIEAMENGGTLSIRVGKEAGSCSIVISDTGHGIPLAERDKIFQLYFTTKPRGTGVGLAMTFRAIQLHGGTIEVDSDSGRGTAFRITLPLAERALPEQAGAA